MRVSVKVEAMAGVYLHTLRIYAYAGEEEEA
jgi:hypothetical protein